MCSYLGGLLEEIERDGDFSGAVFTTVCDQMRRAPECLPRAKRDRAFLLNVPATWKTGASRMLYLSELKRLGRFLARSGGSSPTSGGLARVMLEYDEKRMSLLSLRDRLTPRRFAEILTNFHATGGVEVEIQNDDNKRSGISVALLGGPLTRSAFSLFDVISMTGGHIALDGTETGERTLPRPFSRAKLQDDPLTELADAYFGHIPDTSRRPNAGLYDWLDREIKARAVKGVILVRHLWCDHWHGEVGRLREHLGIPLLELDLGGAEPVVRNRTRVQAFMEILR
jgi:benzoyl-CoA reductase/2-hydroxyglutaryl-CoA dehydratase subunit BcrC/BadD/HgdB